MYFILGHRGCIGLIPNGREHATSEELLDGGVRTFDPGNDGNNSQRDQCLPDVLVTQQSRHLDPLYQHPDLGDTVHRRQCHQAYQDHHEIGFVEHCSSSPSLV